MPRTGPSACEWAQYRELISRLYWDEDQTLKQVVDYMRTHHEFLATQRMYKLRLKSWGLVKNLKADEADRLLDNVYRGAAVAAVPTIRGRVVGSKHFKGRLNRAAKAVKTFSQSSSSSTDSDSDPSSPGLVVLARRSTSPIADKLDAPPIFSVPETCLKLVWQFSQMQFSNGTWDLSGKVYDFRTDKACMCWVDTNMAAEMLMEDRLSPSNWRLLRKAFDQLDVTLIKPDISMVWATYHSVLKLSRIGKDLGRAFLRWMSGLAQIRLGRSHPLTMLFETLQKMEVDEIRLAADAMLVQQFNVVCQNHRLGNFHQIVQYLHGIRKMYEQRALVDEMRDHQDDTDEVGWASWATISLCNLLVYEGRRDEARAVLTTLCQWLETFPVSEVALNPPPDPKGTRLRLLAWLRTHMGSTEYSSGTSRPLTERADSYSHRLMLALVKLEENLSEFVFNGSVYRIFEDDIEMMLSNNLQTLRISDGNYEDDNRISLIQAAKYILHRLILWSMSKELHNASRYHPEVYQRRMVCLNNCVIQLATAVLPRDPSAGACR
ncbi:Clr5 domain-containing protein [Apiospora rasikravindrae]|uniref:Clr5 domain-containing protein n=1 Tax=Apiospora rasikravindrae TaxID=990691 RepID=A0ABR1RNN3_9PEZI